MLLRMDRVSTPPPELCPLEIFFIFSCLLVCPKNVAARGSGKEKVPLEGESKTERAPVCCFNHVVSLVVYELHRCSSSTLFPGLCFHSSPVQPIVETFSTLNNTRLLGENVTFSITLKHTPYPLATVVWMHNGSPINTSSDRMQLSSNGLRLALIDLLPSDRGVYAILVKNDAGSDSVAFSIDIHGICQFLRFAFFLPVV